MKINADLTQEEIAAIGAQAIFAALDESKRAFLLQEAIAALTRRDGYSHRTPLVRAFEEAVEGMAKEIVKQQLESNQELRGRIADVVTQVLSNMFDELGNDLADSLARKILKTLND